MLTYSRVSDVLREFVRDPTYRHYLWIKFARNFGYDPEQWGRVVYSREWQQRLASLPLHSLRVLEISPGPRPVIEQGRVAYYQTVNFPEFDITRDILPDRFDLIIAEQVFEHLRYPYRAARNIHEMLDDNGILFIATPFMLRIHGYPEDYTRWTPQGLSAFLEDCGFVGEVHAWGNRKAVRGNFVTWRDYGWRRDLRNEPQFPVHVWAYARKRLSSNKPEERSDGIGMAAPVGES